MDRNFAEKWATALESGDYQQGKGKLFDGTRYCCLGVACVLLGETFMQNEDAFHWTIDNESGVLPPRIRDKIGMKSLTGYIPSKYTSSLSSLNDRDVTFPEIAKFIRNNVDEL